MAHYKFHLNKRCADNSSSLAAAQYSRSGDASACNVDPLDRSDGENTWPWTISSIEKANSGLSSGNNVERNGKVVKDEGHSSTILTESSKCQQLQGSSSARP